MVESLGTFTDPLKAGTSAQISTASMSMPGSSWLFGAQGGRSIKLNSSRRGQKNNCNDVIIIGAQKNNCKNVIIIGAQKNNCTNVLKK